MAERATVNQTAQVGVESTPGTTVATTKILEATMIEPGIKLNTKTFRPQGRKYSSLVVPGKEWVEAKLSGVLSYSELAYWLSSGLGIVSPTTHSGGVTAKDWSFTPPLAGAANPQTFTIEKGDSVRAYKFGYGLVTDFDFKFSRDSADFSGTMIGQQLTDGITMTVGATALGEQPVLGNQLNFYLDSTYGAIGTTQIIDVTSAEFTCGGIYSSFWPMSRANASFGKHVDLAPKAQFKLKMEADSVGMGPLTAMRAGNTQYMRVSAQGPLVDNLQTVTITGTPTGGTFTLTYKGQTTSGIAYNAAASAVQTALIALSTIGSGNVSVTGSAGGPYTVAFIGALSQDATLMTTSGAGLTGGSSPASAVVAAPIYYTMQLDMAAKVSNVAQFSDDGGIYAIEWTFDVVEDSGLAKAFSITLTNAISSL